MFPTVMVRSRAGHATIFFSYATTTMRQRNIASGTSQGPEKNRKIVRPQCLDGVATINVVKWKLQTTLWRDNMVTLSRAQLCLLHTQSLKSTHPHPVAN